MVWRAPDPEPAGDPEPLPPPTGLPVLPAQDWPPPAEPAHDASEEEVRLDPMALRRRVTLRAGTSSLTVDDARLLVRHTFKRIELAWPDIVGFDVRMEQADAGLVVARTRSGAVELTATRGSSADLRYIRALLLAYQERVRLTS